MFGANIDFVSDNRIIFDISGNKYRLIVHVACFANRVLIKFVGTNKEYNQINPETVSWTTFEPSGMMMTLRWAIAEVSAYFENQPEPGTEEADRFDVLSALIEAYEDAHYPIEAPEPIELIKAHMEMFGRTPADLAVI